MKTMIRNGKSKTPLYKRWVSMLSRCENPNNPAFKHYGGRGITVCERWHTFENFLADMGQPPRPELTLDRKDNSKGYFPGNVKWSTQIEQQRNRRSNLRITFNGQTYTAAEWGERLGVDCHRITKRLWNGWSVEEAMQRPARGLNVTYEGKTQPLIRLCESLGIRYDTVRWRLYKTGLDLDEALTRPLRNDTESLKEGKA